MNGRVILKESEYAIMKKISIIALIFAVGFLTACTSVTREAGHRNNIANTSWTMIEWRGSGAQSNEFDASIKKSTKKVTLTFSSDEVKGVSGKVKVNAGCNNAVGQYTQKNIHTISFGNLASTRMMCAPDVMKVEHALFQKLSEQRFEKLTRTTDGGETLTLKSKDGEKLMFFKRNMASIRK